jgi:hypothetical protein
MAGRLPAGVIPGQIYRHDYFYRDSVGQWQVKYLLVLTGTPDGDVIFRLLTSRAHGRKAEYIRAKGFEPIQHEQMVISYTRKHGRITRSEAADLCHLGPYQATRLLVGMSKKYKEFLRVGEKKGAYYVWKTS